MSITIYPKIAEQSPLVPQKWNDSDSTSNRVSSVAKRCLPEVYDPTAIVAPRKCGRPKKPRLENSPQPAYIKPRPKLTEKSPLASHEKTSSDPTNSVCTGVSSVAKLPEENPEAWHKATKEWARKELMLRPGFEADRIKSMERKRAARKRKREEKEAKLMTSMTEQSPPASQKWNNSDQSPSSRIDASIASARLPSKASKKQTRSNEEKEERGDDKARISAERKLERDEEKLLKTNSQLPLNQVQENEVAPDPLIHTFELGNLEFFDRYGWKAAQNLP